MKIKLKKLYDDVIVPNYAHAGDAGLDLYSRENYILRPQESYIFRTGFAIEIPFGYVVLAWDRSSMAGKYGIKVIGGVYDSTFRGEYGIILCNIGKKEHKIKKGDRIAQLLIQKIETASIEVVKELNETDRGDGEFGSTGK